MRRVLVGLAVLACSLAWAGTANAERKAGDAIPGHYIVVLKQGSKSPKSVAGARGISTQRVYGGAAGTAPETTIRDLKEDLGM